MAPAREDTVLFRLVSGPKNRVDEDLLREAKVYISKASQDVRDSDLFLSECLWRSQSAAHPDERGLMELKVCDKGLGLFAGKSGIKKGTVLVHEPSLLRVPFTNYEQRQAARQYARMMAGKLSTPFDHNPNDPSTQAQRTRRESFERLRRAEELMLAYDQLKMADKIRLFTLAGVDYQISESVLARWPDRTDELKALKSVVTTNRWEAGVLHGTTEMYDLYHSVVDLGSRFNHSCEPNIEDNYSGTTDLHKFVASRDIAPDEEICVSYLGIIDSRMPYTQRQKALRGWRFQCTCSACLRDLDADAEEQKILESVSRLFMEDV